MNWVTANPNRSTWICLILHTEQREQTEVIDSYQIAIGNSNEITDQYADYAAHHDNSEKALLESLFEKLDEHRYDNTYLVTPDQDTLQLLRRRIVNLREHDTELSLRGFKHITLEDPLHDHFGQTLNDHDLHEAARDPPRIIHLDHGVELRPGVVIELWETWTELIALMPPSELSGEPL